MALPNVTINIERSGLGGVTLTSDNIFGLVLTGVAVGATLALHIPYSINSIDEAEAMGITEDVNLHAWQQISAFYNTVGDGAKLWIIIEDENVSLEAMVDKTNINCPAKALLDAAAGEICGIGVSWKPGDGYVVTTLDGLDEKVYQGILNADSLALDYLPKIMPFFTILSGNGFDGEGNDLRDITTMTNARVGVCLGAYDNNGFAAVGMVMGRLASIPVQRKISRIKDGALPILEGFLTDGASINNRLDKLDTIHDKGFIIFRKFPTKAGYYFNGDHTATGANDDLHQVCNIRTIDKALKITYNTYVEELDDEIAITDAGLLDPSAIAALQAKIDTAINLNMSDEISKFSSYIDPAQNILSAPRLNVQLRITPKGYLTDIIVSLGFKNPALTA